MFMYTFLVNLSRSTKRALLLTADIMLIAISFYLAITLRLGVILPDVLVLYYDIAFLLLVIIGGCLAVFFGLDKIKLQSIETHSVFRIGIFSIIMGFTGVVLGYSLNLVAPIAVGLIFSTMFFFFAVLMRLAFVSWMNVMKKRSIKGSPVVVYGSGAAGVQLVSALKQSSEFLPVSFVDDNPSLQGMTIAGLKVGNPKLLSKIVAREKIEKVLLAMPATPQVRKNAIITDLIELGCEVQVLPSYIDIIDGKNLTEILRTVTPDELLGRDKVDLDVPDVAKAYAGRSVMVTGAGGSIGSELCCQLVYCQPERIILFEQSEYALYQIDRDLQPLAKAAGIQVTTRLGSVTDAARLCHVMNENKVDIVLHAAAYKHVPIVEENELEGIRNNVFGTQIAAEAALAAGAEMFILISTDKAVRPTNIMGATKRMSELVIQDLQTRSKTTKFSMVRFGNVLGSSGSVLPLFERQIKAGGPVTVTHSEVTRFFMTITEAARLVLLSGAYSEGGDVFVLDMGQPMKIMDIARRMIALSGHQVKENGVGDIEIKVTGLRPGEKLYEELLLDDDSLRGTPHVKILRAKEKMLSQIEVVRMVNDLQIVVKTGDNVLLRDLIRRWVEGYNSTPQVAVGE